MKKIIIFAVLVFCGAVVAHSQDIVNLRMDRQQLGLRGYVAIMDEDVLVRKDYFREDWPQRKWFVSDLRNVLQEENGRIMTFNPLGRMVTVTYTYQGKKGEKTACSYASNGLLTSFLGEGYRVEAKYSGNAADINVYAETRNYNSSVNLDKADLRSAPYANVYPFDLKCRQELTDDGRVLRSNYFYVDSMPAKSCEYNYNHNQQLVSEKSTEFVDGEKRVSTAEYSYDNRGFLVKRIVHSRGLDETVTFENNEYGDCTKMVVERPYGTVVYTYEYEYDTMTNWTVRLQFEDGVFDNAVLRTLTYHKSPKEQRVKNVDEEKSSKKLFGDKKSRKESNAVEQEGDEGKKVAKGEKAKKGEGVEKGKKGESVEKDKKGKKVKKDGKSDNKAVGNDDKSMSKEEKKAAKEKSASVNKAEKERAAAEKKAQQKNAAAEKKAEKERVAAEKKAEKERAAAEKKAEKERAAAEKKAEKERAAAEKKNKK